MDIARELQQLSTGTYVAARGIAEIYIGLAERDLTFDWLEKAFAEHNGWLIHAGSNPRYDSIRAAPRYADLVQRIGLT